MFSSAKTLKPNKMVRTRRICSQEGDEEGLARVLNFDNVLEERELQMIPETLEDLVGLETSDQIEQHEISAGVENKDEGNSVDSEVAHLFIPLHYISLRFFGNREVLFRSRSGRARVQCEQVNGAPSDER